LPAEPKSTTPALRACVTALCTVLEKLGPPRLMLITLARCGGSVPEVLAMRAAYLIALAMSKLVPPSTPSTRRLISFDDQLMPATPELLFETAPIVPETCVPWNEFGCTPSPSPSSVGSGSIPSPSAALEALEMKS